MMADIMYRKQDYEQVVLHFEQLLEHKPGALELLFINFTFIYTHSKHILTYTRCFQTTTRRCHVLLTC